jgi:hypothetical protein
MSINDNVNVNSSQIVHLPEQSGKRGSFIPVYYINVNAREARNRNVEREALFIIKGGREP